MRRGRRCCCFLLKAAVVQYLQETCGEGANTLEYHVGDVVKMKKPHPCGCDLFTITRVGMDFKLRCNGCGREVMVPRQKAEKSIRSIQQPAKEQ